MTEIIKAWDIYVNNRKVGTATGTDSNIDAPGELAQTADGIIGRAQGMCVAKVTLNTVVTVGGKANTQALLTAIVTNTPVKLAQGIVDGGIREYKTMWCHSEQLSSDFANGTAKGVYQFEGAPPKVTKATG